MAMRVISVIRSVLNRDQTKAFQSATFYTAVEKAVHKCISKYQSVDAVTTRMIGAPASTVSVVKFIKHDVEKNSIENANMEEHAVKLAEVIDEKRTEEENRIPTMNTDSVRSPRLPDRYNR